MIVAYRLHEASTEEKVKLSLQVRRKIAFLVGPAPDRHARSAVVEREDADLAFIVDRAALGVSPFADIVLLDLELEHVPDLVTLLFRPFVGRVKKRFVPGVKGEGPVTGLVGKL